MLAVVGVTATAALRSELLGEVDTRLAAAVDRSAHADGHDLPGWDDGAGPDFLVVPGQGDGTLGALVAGRLVEEAAVIGAGGEGEALTAEEAAPLADVDPDGGATTVDLGRLGEYRVVAATVGPARCW